MNEEPIKQNLFQAFGGYIKQTVKGGKKNMKKENNKEIPKPAEDSKFKAVEEPPRFELSEEELESQLTEIRRKKEELKKQEEVKEEKEVQVITYENLILMKLSNIENILKEMVK